MYQTKSLQISLCQRCLLREKKVLDRSITELKQKAATELESVSNDAVEELGKIVKGRDNINKKLSTTYSLGRDRVVSAGSKHFSPLHGGDDKMRSYSFQDGRRGNVTIFHPMSHSSSSSSSSMERTTSSYSNYRETSTTSSSMEDDNVLHEKGKNVVVEDEISSSLVSSPSSSGVGRLIGKHGASPSNQEKLEMKESSSWDGVDMAQSKSDISRRKCTWLNRRTMSLTN